MAAGPSFVSSSLGLLAQPDIGLLGIAGTSVDLADYNPGTLVGQFSLADFLVPGLLQASVVVEQYTSLALPTGLWVRQELTG